MGKSKTGKNEQHNQNETRNVKTQIFFMNEPIWKTLILTTVIRLTQHHTIYLQQNEQIKIKKQKKK